MASLIIEPREAALLVVDMQNGFCHPDGTLARDGADISMMRQIIPNVRRLVDICRQRGIPDIWTIQEHFAEDRTRELHKIVPHTMKRFRPPCLKGTWDAEIVDELKPLIDDRSHLIRKQKFSAFYNTNLEVLTRILGARTLIVSGVTSNACIETSLREAYMRDFDLLIVEDCIGGISRELHESAVRVWGRFLGMVVKAEELPEILVGAAGGAA
jgi:ureidoacrylate peracid hydrolase